MVLTIKLNRVNNIVDIYEYDREPKSKGLLDKYHKFRILELSFNSILPFFIFTVAGFSKKL